MVRSKKQELARRRNYNIFRLKGFHLDSGCMTPKELKLLKSIRDNIKELISISNEEGKKLGLSSKKIRYDVYYEGERIYKNRTYSNSKHLRGECKVVKSMDYNWGTIVDESLEDYIIRIENQIDKTLESNIKISNHLIEIICDIFLQVITVGHKRKQMENLISKNMNRECTYSDLEEMYFYVKDRLLKKVNRGKLESSIKCIE